MVEGGNSEPGTVAHQVANLPPTGALFAAFLDYDPMNAVLPSAVIQGLPTASKDMLFSINFFSSLISAPFDAVLRIAFAISIVFPLIAAVASALSGKRFIYEEEIQPQLNLELAANPADPPGTVIESQVRKRK